MENLEEVKEAKIKEAVELYAKLGIGQLSDYDTFNFHYHFNELQDSTKYREDNEKKLHWTRLSNTSNAAPTIG